MAAHGAGRRPSRLGAIPRRLRAVLAGGLILGLGGSLTLASWSDSEFGQASFTASRFDTESSINGTNYSDSSASPGTALTFSGTGMSPGAVRYASLWIRTKSTSTVDGTLTVQGATTTVTAGENMTSALNYRVVSMSTAGGASASCDATQFAGGASPFVVGNSSNKVPLATAGAAVPIRAGGALVPVRLCFEVTMLANAANTLQGAGLTATWEVKAVSNP